MTDEQLLAGYLAGEEQDVATIDAWIAGASTSFRRRLGSGWDDLQQEVRLEVFELLQRGRFERRSSLKTYVWRVATHSCLDAVRKLGRVREVDPEPVFERLCSTEERADRALAKRQSEASQRRMMSLILSKLGPQCLVMWRAVLAGESYRQMSETFGVSAGTLRVRVLRCRQKARTLRVEFEQSPTTAASAQTEVKAETEENAQTEANAQTKANAETEG